MKHEDWTLSKNNVNICTGCRNDCVYCYAKEMAYRFGQVSQGQWHNMLVRQKDVDKHRKLYSGIVGFPTSHDITPENLDAYMVVLRKLIDVGNRVLIITKPRIDCIKAICDSFNSEFDKDHILFRFTIGSPDNKILKTLEPGAPLYEERYSALMYAARQEFITSLSIEPIIDYHNTINVINDLYSYVTETIWLGTMSKIDSVIGKANGNAKILLGDIKQFQTRKVINNLTTQIGLRDTDNKIRYKTSIKEIISIES